MTTKSHIKVAIRLRPPISRDPISDSSLVEISSDNQTTRLKSRPGTRKGDKVFKFDYSLDSLKADAPNYISQSDMYDLVGQEMLINTLEGYNSTVLAYGQTGSGKTFTMHGDHQRPGLVPLLFENLFSSVLKLGEESVNVKIKMSYIEIYQEQVFDLLDSRRSTLKVRENQNRQPYVESLSDYQVTNFDEVKRLLNGGNSRRTTALTGLNESSSRSHSILTISVVQEKFDRENLGVYKRVSSCLKLVDLAGSEKAAATLTSKNDKVDTAQRFKEGSNINRSLTTLGRILTAVAENSVSLKKPHVIPYRESVLTWLLKDSIGGNAKTLMIACISPFDYDETLSTLRYATVTSRISNSVSLNKQEQVSENYIVEHKKLLSYIDELETKLSDSVLDSDDGKDDKELVKLKNYIRFIEECQQTYNFKQALSIRQLNVQLAASTKVNDAYWSSVMGFKAKSSKLAESFIRELSSVQVPDDVAFGDCLVEIDSLKNEINHTVAEFSSDEFSDESDSSSGIDEEV